MKVKEENECMKRFGWKRAGRVEPRRAKKTALPTALALSAIILSALLLAACSRKGTVSGQDGPVRIRLVYSAGDLKWKSAVEDTAEAFMKENEDIEIELYNMPEIKNRTYVESLKILAAQEEFYDIVELRETGTVADAGLLAPVPESVYSLVENPGMYGGVCYGVPRYFSTLGIIYNRDIFEELGLDTPDTYEEFLDICASLASAGYDPLALGAADVWHMKFWGNYLFRNYIVTEDGDIRWTTERAEKMLSDYRRLAERGFIDESCRTVSDSQTAQELSSGRAAMVYTGPWMLSQIESLNPQVRLGFFFLPGADGVTYAVADSNVEWGISAKTAADHGKMAAAERFLQFYYSEGVYENVLEIMNGESVTVRPIRMPDTQNQRIMETAYASRPVRTDVLLENVSAPDGFFTYFAQLLPEVLWGDESIYALARELTGRWEAP